MAVKRPYRFSHNNTTRGESRNFFSHKNHNNTICPIRAAMSLLTNSCTYPRWPTFPPSRHCFFSYAQEHPLSCHGYIVMYSPVFKILSRFQMFNQLISRVYLYMRLINMWRHLINGLYMSAPIITLTLREWLFRLTRFNKTKFTKNCPPIQIPRW